MTTAGLGHQPSALMLLFGSDDDTPRVIARRLLAVADSGDLGPALEHLPQTMRGAATHELAVATAGLLDLNLIDVIITGWREHADLTAAARRTLASPGSTELVGLVAHRVTMTQQPYVSLLADGHRIATLELQLSLELDITAVVARVHAGRLTALQSGHCDVTATLAMQGIDVETQRARLELPGVIGLGTGVPLLRHGLPGSDSAGDDRAGDDRADNDRADNNQAGDDLNRRDPAAREQAGSQHAAIW